MTAREGRGAVLRACACVLLATLAGCAWFQEPPPPIPVGATAVPPSVAGADGELPPPVSRPFLTGRPDSLGTAPDSLGTAPGSAESAAPDSLGIAPDAATPGEAATTGEAAAPGEAGSRPDTTAGAPPGAPVTDPPAAEDDRPFMQLSETSPGANVPPEPAALSGDDLWDLTGDDLSAETGPGGQLIRVTRPLVTHGTLTVVSPRGLYLVDPQMARFMDGVSFTDGETHGTSETAVYHRTTGMLEAEGDVVVISEADSLRLASERARYDRPAETLTFLGQVRGKKGDRRMVAEEAEWVRGRREVLLRRHVRVTDEAGETTITGDLVHYDLETDRARVTEEPALVLDGGDGPIRVTGTRLWVEPDGNASAAGGVRVERGGVTAIADSAAFFRDTWQAVLYGSPRVTEREGTLTGDTLILNFSEDQALERADVLGNALVHYTPVDSARAGENSVVGGQFLSMYFVDGIADRVDVFGEAWSRYAPADSDSSSGAGTNAAEGDTISIFIREGEVDRVLIRGDAHGVYTFRSRESAAAEAGPGPGDPPDAPPGPLPNAPPDTLVLGGEAPPEEASYPGPGTVPADSLAAGAGVGAADTVAVEKVIYKADIVEFSTADRVVDLESRCQVDYGPLTLNAGKVRFFTDRRYMEAEDDPSLLEHRASESDRKVDGTHMDYSLESQEGTIDGGRTKAEDGYIFSDRLRRVGNEEFMARQGSYTTCDNIGHGEDPHFHFTSKRMRIYLGDKVVAKPVVLYIRDIPVFALPFYVFSVRKGRQSGFLTPDIDFGLGQSTGRYFRNLGYYWAASEYYDFTFSADYQDTPSRFVGRVRTRYNKRYLMDGDFTLASTIGSTQREYDVHGAHRMNLGEWAVTARAEFRDAEFRANSPLGSDFGARLDRILESDLSASRRWNGSSLALTFERRQDLAADPTDGRDEVILRELLPGYSFALQSRFIGREADEDGEGARLPFLSNTRFSFSSRGSSTRTQTEDTTILTAEDAEPDTLFGILDERNSAAQHTLNLNDSRKIFGAFNLTPGFRVSEHWMDREFSATDTTKGFNRAAVWSASLTTNTSVYGTFRGLGPVQVVRHTMQPSASFSYQPDFDGLTYLDDDGVRRNRYPGVSAFESQLLNLTLRNGFQAKVRSGDEQRRVDLVNWSLGTRYDFLAGDRGQQGWSDVASTVDVPKVLGVDVGFNSVHDPYHQFRFQSYQARALFGFRGRLPGSGDPAPEPPPEDDRDLDRGSDESFNRIGGSVGSGLGSSVGSRAVSAEALAWNAGFSFSQTGQRAGDEIQSSSILNGSFNIQLTQNWSFSYSANWDITAGEVAGETINLRRNLHCWEASFTRSQLGDETTFYFRINIKNMQDIKYEYGQRGSGFGGITEMLP